LRDVEGKAEGCRARIDRNVRPVDAAKLAGIRVHMDQLLARVGAFQQRVIGRRHLREAPTEEQNEVGLLDGLSQDRIDADPNIAGIAGVQVIEERLSAEGAADGQFVALGKARKPADRFRRPARPAENGEGTLGFRDQPFDLFHLLV
jgi:hypothetical protein